MTICVDWPATSACRRSFNEKPRECGILTLAGLLALLVIVQENFAADQRLSMAALAMVWLAKSSV